MGEEREYTCSLSISAAEFERHYRGQASSVLARDAEGRTLRFPALPLRQFLTREGVHGTFVIRVAADNRLLDIRRREP
jgi:hypothetical protein